MLKAERDELIKAYNMIKGNETRRVKMWNEFSGVSK